MPQPRGNSAHERGPARLVANEVTGAPERRGDSTRHADGSKYHGYHKGGTDRHQDRGGGHGTPGSSHRPSSTQKGYQSSHHRATGSQHQGGFNPTASQGHKAKNREAKGSTRYETGSNGTHQARASSQKKEVRNSSRGTAASKAEKAAASPSFHREPAPQPKQIGNSDTKRQLLDELAQDQALMTSQQAALQKYQSQGSRMSAHQQKPNVG